MSSSSVRWPTEIFNMPTSHIFLIDSDSSGHRLIVDGNGAGTFASRSAAEAMAAYIAQCILPTATLKFELAFKWTLSDLETRAATLEVPQPVHMENSYVDR
jgi:hypothetical protein